MLRQISTIPDKVVYIHRIQQSVILTGDRYGERIKKQVHYTNVYKSTVNIVATSGKNLLQVKNDPISNVLLISDRWALIDNCYAVPIDYDFVMDILTNAKVNTGKVDGKFIWASVGNKIKLVRIGSNLYKQILDSDRRSKLPKIKTRNFEIGTVYSTPTGIKELYLGKINTKAMVYSYATKKKEIKTITNRHLFYRLNNKIQFGDEINLEEVNRYDLSLRQTHSFVEAVSKITVEKEIISKIRDAFIKKLKETILANTANGANNARSWIESEYRMYHELIHMYKVTEPVPQEFDLEKYLTFM